MEIKVTIGLDEKVTKILNDLIGVLNQKHFELPKETIIGSVPKTDEKEVGVEVVPSEKQKEDPIPTVVPVSAPSYTLSDLQKAAGELVNLGKSSDLVEVLNGFGVSALTQLSEEKYGEFALKLRHLGGNI